MTEVETCCGFGGTFAAKFPMISTAMGDVKCANRRRDRRGIHRLERFELPDAPARLLSRQGSKLKRFISRKF
jgi:hypothetical protein